MKSTNLRIAIQKNGKLTADSIELLKELGFKFQTEDRKLIAICKNQNNKILFTRDDDIPNLVKIGAADIGLVGKDVLIENGTNLLAFEELTFGKCNLSVAVPITSGIREIKKLNGKRIATSYPNITKSFFEKQNIQVEVIKLEGGVEIAPALGIADAIVDVVSSGKTLKMNGLKAIQKVMDISAVIIAKDYSTIEYFKKVNQKESTNEFIFKTFSNYANY